MRAMVLAAGLGSRLRPLTSELPKPAVPVGNRPLAWFALDHLRRQGFEDVVLNTHYLGETLEQTLKPFLPSGLRVQFSVERELLGTGGGIRKAEPLLREGSEPILVMNSDILFAPNTSRIRAHHEALDAIATMVLRPDPQAQRYGPITAADGRVYSVLGKSALDASGRGTPGLGTSGGGTSGREPASQERAYMFTGVHLLAPRAFEDLPPQGCIIRSAYDAWITRGEIIGAVIDRSPWRDLGTIAAYHQANLDLAAGALIWPGIEATGSSIIHTTARVSSGVQIVRSVIGPRADVCANVSDCVVWSDAVIRTPVCGSVVTSADSVPVK